jgi:hypothetical protein
MSDTLTDFATGVVLLGGGVVVGSLVSAALNEGISTLAGIRDQLEASYKTYQDWELQVASAPERFWNATTEATNAFVEDQTNFGGDFEFSPNGYVNI